MKAWLLLSGWLFAASFARAADPARPPRLENEALRIDLSPQDGSITVVDKRIDLTWRQQVEPGFKIAPETLRVTAGSISCRVSGPRTTFDLTIALKEGTSPSFDLTVAIPDQRYVTLLGYPFHFVAPDNGWFYVQNTSGEGMLMPLDRPGDIKKAVCAGAAASPGGDLPICSAAWPFAWIPLAISTAGQGLTTPRFTLCRCGSIMTLSPKAATSRSPGFIEMTFLPHIRR